MSWQAVEAVFERSAHRGSALLVLLAIAKHAHPDGSGAFPKAKTLARMAKIHERHVRRIILEKLVPSGELKLEERPGKSWMMTIAPDGAATQIAAPSRRSASGLPPEVSGRGADISGRGAAISTAGAATQIADEASLETSSETSLEASALKSERLTALASSKEGERGPSRGTRVLATRCRCRHAVVEHATSGKCANAMCSCELFDPIAA